MDDVRLCINRWHNLKVKLPLVIIGIGMDERQDLVLQKLKKSRKNSLSQSLLRIC